MLFALCIAVLAVAVGLLLGLAPAVSRRALGPLRTLALTSVLAVVGLHLLPEALGELGALGLLGFAAGLALPRWMSAFRGHAGGHGSSQLGLSLGYWGLLVHHVGDGLALGAYSREDASGGHAHTDVLLALVLHTVPFVAVVAAGYAAWSGTRSAIRRSAGLALASVVGVLGARLIPPLIVDAAQAWIAAGVSGLLLHGLSHDLARDLPKGLVLRGVDIAMAALGAALGVVGAQLDAHEEGRAAGSAVLLLLESGVERLAVPLCLGLVFGAVLSARDAGPASRYAAAAEPSGGGPFSPEAFLITLGWFGWYWALARDLLAAILRFPGLNGALAAPVEGASALAPPESGLRGFVARLDARVDAIVAWALIGVVMAAVIRGAVPDAALAGRPWVAFGAALIFSLSVPVHAVAAPQLALALLDRGLPAPAALIIAVLTPLAARSKTPGHLLRVALVAGVAALVADHLPRSLVPVDATVSWIAAGLLGVWTLRRVFLLGFRGFLAPLTRDA